jgi:hypothetical protein
MRDDESERSMPRSGQPTETELKLTVPPAVENRLGQLPAFRPPAASEPRTEHIVTTYFDTPECDLALARLARSRRRARAKAMKALDGRWRAYRRQDPFWA